jgi:hypothetical protein
MMFSLVWQGENERTNMNFLIVEGVDITHTRLVDLTRLADQAEPFYDWVEAQFQAALTTPQSLDEILVTSQ